MVTAGVDRLQYPTFDDNLVSPSASASSTSPLGPISQASTRKLLVNLIITMNQSFQDYDFRYWRFRYRH